ncbi:MAG: hypothetical protein JWO96_439 [Candidatus Saccharibacteria bacterium]|nr:hypothetical protein [Candidatus Saccharibacteria bacterium]
MPPEQEENHAHVPTAEAADITVDSHSEFAGHEANLPGEESHHSHEPTHAPPTQRPSSHLKRNIVTALVVALNLGMGSASATLLLKKPAPQTAASNLVTQKPIAAAQNPSSIKDAPATKLEHYVSQPLNLEFDYPIDWHINSDAGNTWITISSPTTDIIDDSGRTVKGSVQIQLTSKYPPSSFIDDSLVTSAPSEPITYSNPTNAQRKSTNISFARYSSDPADSISYFFVSGNLAYSKGQRVQSKEYQSINPFISVYINSCLSKCQALSVSQISLDTYHSNPMLVKTTGIIQSMRFN